jgi:hypothetical protein
MGEEISDATGMAGATGRTPFLECFVTETHMDFVAPLLMLHISKNIIEGENKV